MNMGRADKKRVREEQDLSPPENSCREKQASFMEFEAGMGFEKAENAGTEKFPGFCSLSNENSMLLKDSWSWEDSEAFGIRSIAAIRKQSYMLDYLQDSLVDKSSEKEVAEQQVEEEENCLRVSFFEATDDLLWRPQSPLPNTEALFCLDSMGSHDCTSLLQDESIVQGVVSCFRIWEQDADKKYEKNDADSIRFVCESGVSDWTWGAISSQSQFSESVEF